MVGNIEVEEKQISLFRKGPVIKCFVIPPNSKLGKTAKKSRRNLLTGVNADWLTNLPRFQGARLDHVRVQSSCFPRELVSFVRPRALVSFDPRQVTRSPPIGKRI